MEGRILPRRWDAREDAEDLCLRVGVKKHGVQRPHRAIGALAHRTELVRVRLIHHLAVHAIRRDDRVQQPRHVARRGARPIGHGTHGRQRALREPAALLVEGVGGVAGDGVPVVDRLENKVIKPGLGMRSRAVSASTAAAAAAAAAAASRVDCHRRVVHGRLQVIDLQEVREVAVGAFEGAVRVEPKPGGRVVRVPCERAGRAVGAGGGANELRPPRPVDAKVRFELRRQVVGARKVQCRRKAPAQLREAEVAVLSRRALERLERCVAVILGRAAVLDVPRCHCGGAVRCRGRSLGERAGRGFVAPRDRTHGGDDGREGKFDQLGGVSSKAGGLVVVVGHPQATGRARIRIRGPLLLFEPRLERGCEVWAVARRGCPVHYFFVHVPYVVGPEIKVVRWTERAHETHQG